MAGVSFNKAYLERLLRFKIDDKKLAFEITKMGIELKGINEDYIEVDITPNRPDLLDAVGFARSVRHFMHKAKPINYSLNAEDADMLIDVGAGVKKVRPFIAGLVAKGVSLDDSSLEALLNFTDKLSETYGRKRSKLAIGIHNLDALKPHILYDTFGDEAFVPLEYKEEMKYSRLIEIDSRGRDYKYTIKGAIAKGMFPVLKDAGGVLALIPIINSERTKISESTKNLFIDITGTNKYIVEKIADMLACMFIDMDGDVKKVAVRYDEGIVKTPVMAEKNLSIDLIKIEEQIGIAIGFNNVISLANKMGYNAKLIGKKINFSLPKYRLDIISEQDVIEDMAIAYGYEYIREMPLYASQPGSLEADTNVDRLVSRLLVGLGFTEEANSYLVNEEQNFTKMRLSVPKKDEYIRILDSKTHNITMLRTWLLTSLMKNLAISAQDSMPQKIFEADLSFVINNGKAEERRGVAGAWADPKANFNDMKAIVYALLKGIGIPDFETREFSHNSFIDGRCAAIFHKKKRIGFFGEIHPEVLYNFGIEESTFAFELDL